MGTRVRGEKRGNVYYLNLARPEKRNALSIETFQEVSQAVESLMVDSEVRVVILRGDGPVFSAGVDFAWLGEIGARFLSDAAAGGALIRAEILRGQQYLNRLEVVELPIICAMQGAVLGMAAELALACDIRLMSQECLWGVPEARFGILADLGGTARLSTVLGAARALEVLATGKRFSAQEALQWGFVNHVYPSPDALFAAADALAQDICGMAPMAVGAMKKIVRKGQGAGLMNQLDLEATLQSILMRSEDFREAVQSLGEKRAPQWKRK